MVRTLVIAGIVTLLGATESDAQYRDSYPPDDQYVSEYQTESTYDGGYYDGYDEELLGSPDYRYGRSEPDIDVGIFGSLSSDGRWHLTANFGWVWRPYATVSYRPYHDGRWVWTSYGWTWVSYEPYAWATYHYGYWARDPYLGWIWIPGYEWAASRVQFAYYDNYIAWTPMMPVGYHCPSPWSTFGVSVWFTIGADRFCDPYPSHYYVAPKYKSHYKTAVAYKAPARNFVERYSGHAVRTETVQFKNKSWTKGSSTSAKFTERGGSSKGSTYSTTPRQVKSKSFAQKSTGKALNAQKSKSVRQPEARVLKESRGKSSRQSFTQQTQRSVQKREAVKSQRVAPRENRVVRNERPSNSSRQKVSANRESRSTQKVERAQRTERSRPSFQTSRSRSSGSDRKAISSNRSSGSDRKAMTSRGSSSGGNKAERRDVAKTKSSKSEKGRGKAR